MSGVCSEQFGVTTPSPLSLSSSRTVILKSYPDEYELPSKALIETSKTLSLFESVGFSKSGLVKKIT